MYVKHIVGQINILFPQNGLLQKTRDACNLWNFKLKLRSFSMTEVHKTDKRATNSSLLDDEAEKFSNLSGKWWDIHGEFRALHSMNNVRIPFIRDCLLYEAYAGSTSTSKPLRGIDILDIGCGGGILSEPLARLGANVVGIDATEEAVTVAKKHRPPALDNLQYLTALAEDLDSVGSLKFDAVIASEVAEHVAEPSSFLKTCTRLLKPRGSLFISTINRTFLSYILAVTFAENVMRVVPPGTHDWNKLITPRELEEYLSSCECTIRKVHGILYNPLCNDWTFISNTDMNYIVHATRNQSVIDSMPENS